MLRKATSLLTAVALAILALPSGAQADTVNWNSNISTGTEVTWYATNTYVLTNFTYVLSNAVLKIQPGTVIKGSGGAAGTNSTTLGALIVTRGGKLFAEGTQENPIIFTAISDDVNDPNDLPLYTSGLWGGVTLLGNGVLNTSQDGTGGSSSPIYDVYEGLPDDVVDGQNVHRFGGSDDNDSSGTLRYVSIRYSGFTFAGDKELNGLTMGAIGKGTTLDHVEVIGSSDDGFEWWGGCVDAQYLSAAFCEDDCFDFDQGFRGSLQYLFAIQKPTVADCIIETDGDLSNGDAAVCSPNQFPRTVYTIHNLTAIGSGLGGGDKGVNSRDESGPNIFNSAFLESTSGMDIDSDGANAWVAPIGTCGYATMSNTVFEVVNFAVNGVENALLTGFNVDNVVGSPLVSVSRAADAGLDPRPAAGSILLTNVLAQTPMRPHETNGCSFVQTCYRGAFSEDSIWLNGWTGLEDLGVLAGSVITPTPNAPILVITRAGANVEISWQTQAGFSYELQESSPINVGWTTIDTIIGTGGVESSLQAVATGGAESYYRVVAE